jgi:hypothetical protein
MTTTEPQAWHQLAQELGMIAIGWNNIETDARSMLVAMGGEGAGLMACAAMLGNIPLINALRATSKLIGSFEAEIDRFSECMDRLRSYRNHYIHGVHFTRDGEHDDAYVTIIGSETSHGKYSITNEVVTREQLIYPLRHIMRLQYYGNALSQHVQAKHGAPLPVEPALPPLPPLPEIPKKLVRKRMTVDEYLLS